MCDESDNIYGNCIVRRTMPNEYVCQVMSCNTWLLNNKINSIRGEGKDNINNHTFATSCECNAVVND